MNNKERRKSTTATYDWRRGVTYRKYIWRKDLFCTAVFVINHKKQLAIIMAIEK